MRWTYLSLFVLAIVLMPSAAADAEKLYDAWHYWGDTFERDSIIYYIERSASPSKLLLYVGDDPYILRVGECKDNLQGIHEKYCLEEAAYESPDDFEKYIKYESGEELFGYHLFIYSVVPELKASRTVRPSSPEIKEQSTITVTLNNDGENPITDIRYEENITEPLALNPLDGEASGDAFVYELSRLGAGQSRTFQYGVKPEDYVSATITPYITYSYLNVKKSLSLSALTFSVAQPITITRSLSSGAITVGEKTSYDIELTNNEINNIDFRTVVELPGTFVVDSTNLLHTDTYRYEKPFRSGETETVSISMKAPMNSEGKIYPLTLSLNSSDDLGKKCNKALELVDGVLVYENQLRSGQQDTITFEFEADNESVDKIFDMLMTLELPHSVLVESEQLQRSQSILEYEGTIRNGDSEAFSIDFHSPLSGEYRFPLTVEASVNDNIVKRYYTETVNVKTEQLEPRIQFSKTDNKLRTGEPGTLRVYMKNNDDINSYVDIDTTLNCPLLGVNKRIKVDKVVPSEDKLVKEISVVGPQIDGKNTDTCTLTGTYETKGGEEFEILSKVSIQLEPFETYFTIIQKASETTVEPGETVSVTVDVKNEEDRILFANIYDTFSESIPVTAGKTFAELSFNPKQQRQVYLYELTVPEDFDKESFLITTKVYEEASGADHETSLVINVGKEAVVVPEPEEEEQTNHTGDGDEPQEPIPEDEKSWLQKAWAWIVGFFS